MKKVSANIIDKLAEHIYETDTQTITHLSLKKDQEVPEHKSDRWVNVIIYKGEVLFSASGDETIIKPGDVIILSENELHALKANEDSEILVIKSKIK